MWPSIERALAASSWFVLMASPAAARSSWVNREVEWWPKHRSAERILVVLTEGRFAWADDGDQDGEDAALPPALKGAVCERV